MSELLASLVDIPFLRGTIFELNSLHLGWISFWALYWGLACALPSPKDVIRNPGEYNKKKLYTSLFSNMGVTLAWAYLFQHYVPCSIPTRSFAWEEYLYIYFRLWVASELANFGTHWIMHRPSLYFSHKAHHAYIHASPLAGVYVSWHEMLVENPLLVFMFYRYHNMTPVEVVFFSSFYAYNAVRTHSGVSQTMKPTSLWNRFVIWIMDDRFHAVHHRRGDVNYGFTGLLDWMCGTYVDPGSEYDKIMNHYDKVEAKNSDKTN